MSATRTQIYLTEQQRRQIDVIAEARGLSLAEVIRQAVDRYLTENAVDPTIALTSTFGGDPLIELPDREEWDRG
jgi:hypothetical protein